MLSSPRSKSDSVRLCHPRHLILSVRSRKFCQTRRYLCQALYTVFRPTLSTHYSSIQTWSTIEIVHDTHTGYILRDPDSELAGQRCFIAVRNLRATNRIDIDSMQAKSTGICRAKVQRDLGNKSECLHECLPTAGCREVIYFLTSATMYFLLLIFLVPMTGMVRLLSRSSNKRCRTLVSGSGGTMSLPLQDLKTGTFYRPECARAPPNNAHRSFPALHLRMIACS